MHISMAANGGELLPHSPEPDSDQCSKPSENMYCFKAGKYNQKHFKINFLANT